MTGAQDALISSMGRPTACQGMQMVFSVMPGSTWQQGGSNVRRGSSDFEIWMKYQGSELLRTFWEA